MSRLGFPANNCEISQINFAKGSEDNADFFGHLFLCEISQKKNLLLIILLT